MEMQSLSDITAEENEIKRPLSGADQSFLKTCQHYLPSKKKIMLAISQLFIIIFLYASMYGILGKDALPESEIFALLLLYVLAHIGGKLASIVKLPPLIGMLIIGFLFRNLPFIPYYRNISNQWATTLRSAAFVIILLKAGLGLDAEKLKALKRIVFQLAFFPCIIETIVSGISSHFLLGLPWTWAIMFGFVLSAVSPAVVVPGLLNLQERSFGVKKGIPTLVIAAASMDDILAITGFSVMLGASLTGDHLGYALLNGIWEPTAGLICGILFGFIFRFIPSSENSSSTLLLYHITMLCLGGFTGMFVSKKIGIAGAGPMSCLVMAFVASLGWKKDVQHLEGIQKIIGVMWNLLQPFLFSLIGAEVLLQNLRSNLDNTILALLLGFVFRIITATIASFGGDFNLKEKVFIAVAWFPKATVQAAVGPQPLDYVLTYDKGEELENHAQKILTGAVLSIIMTAPIGAALIAILGPLLLTKDSKENERNFNELEENVSIIESRSEKSSEQV